MVSIALRIISIDFLIWFPSPGEPLCRSVINVATTFISNSLVQAIAMTDSPTISISKTAKTIEVIQQKLRDSFPDREIFDRTLVPNRTTTLVHFARRFGSFAPDAQQL
jgi:hypothetical protein